VFPPQARRPTMNASRMPAPHGEPGPIVSPG
jgi:hypothetical protein